jgi:hypothetical protein
MQGKIRVRGSIKQVVAGVWAQKILLFFLVYDAKLQNTIPVNELIADFQGLEKNRRI